MDDRFVEAMIGVQKQSALSEQLKRMAVGVSARLCLHPRKIYHGDNAGDIGFYWQQRRSDSWDEGELVFAVSPGECLDKTDEEIAALVEKHMPGYAARLDAARAEKKRRQRIRVQYNNQQISFKREQERKRITRCAAPGCKSKEPIVAIRASKKFCSAACRQRARRRWA